MKLKNNLYRIASEDHDKRTFSLSLIPDCTIYRAHFPGQPITPGVCIIQIASELLTRFCELPMELCAVQNAKYLAVINPVETPVVEYKFRRVIIDDESRSAKVSVEVRDTDRVFTKLSLVYRVK